jgi:hypothetical protein
LISAIADDLGNQLAPRYFVAVETHTYVALPGPTAGMGVRYPDLMVVQRETAPVAARTRVAAPETESFLIELTELEPLIEGFLQVRLVSTGEVVTVIELLSHTNKHSGEHRDEYLEKRASLMRSNVNFVELDLLRASIPMPQTGPHISDYRFFVRRRTDPFQARVYPFDLQQPIPKFPLPLQPDDDEPLLDIHSLLKQVYARARYDLVLDYSREPEPALRGGDRAWVAQQLQASLE